jgi:hypothetical protein
VQAMPVSAPPPVQQFVFHVAPPQPTVVTQFCEPVSPAQAPPAQVSAQVAGQVAAHVGSVSPPLTKTASARVRFLSVSTLSRSFFTLLIRSPSRGDMPTTLQRAITNATLTNIKTQGLFIELTPKCPHWL